MARGHFRTDKKMCVCCGKSGPGVKTFAVGQSNIPSYHCESCFDAFASEFEKINKEKLLVSVDGELVKTKKIDIVGRQACTKRGFYSGKPGIIHLSDTDSAKYKLIFENGEFVFFNRTNQVVMLDC